MINSVSLVGRLTKDPELKYTPNGVAMARFTLAINRTFTNQNGEREADFPNIVVYRKQAENVANWLKKGSLAGVEGSIRTGSFEGRDGGRVYITEIVANNVHFLESRAEQERRTNTSHEQEGPPREQPQSNPEVSDDDLPF